jgi:DNA transformation protein
MLQTDRMRCNRHWSPLHMQRAPSSAQIRSGADATRLTELRGLGPASVALLQTLGINSPQTLRQQDPFAVFARLRAEQPQVSLNLLYALIGAIEDRDWREVARTERTTVLMRLEDMGLLR